MADPCAPVMLGATSSDDGLTGLVPKPFAGDNLKFLRGDATWQFPTLSGPATSSGLTMATAHVLGRSTAGTGAIESISIGAGLLLAAGTLGVDSTVLTTAGTQTLINKTLNGANNFITNVSLATGVTGNLPVARLNGGTGASGTTFWAGDGTWKTAGAGTVTSVSLTVPSGLSVTGSPVTTTGTLAITTALNGIIKGNGTGFLAATAGTDYEVPLTFSTGLTRATNTVTVNAIQNITRLSNLTTNGFVKTTGANGTLSVDTSTYITGNQTITLGTDLSGSGATTLNATIVAGAVTLAKMANLAANSIIGNNTGSPATPLALTGTQVTAMLTAMVGDSGSGGTKGLVPAPASGDAAALKFLKADGTWAVPAGAGSSPLTTKGDLYTYSTVNARLPVGADTFVLTADSTQATGVKWAAPTTGTGTVNSGTATQLAYYASSGTAVSSTSAYTIGGSGNPTITASAGQNLTLASSTTGEVTWSYGGTASAAFKKTSGGSDVPYFVVGDPTITPLFPTLTKMLFVGAGVDPIFEMSGSTSIANSGISDIIFTNRGTVTGTTRLATIQALTAVSSKDIGKLIFLVKKSAADTGVTAALQLESTLDASFFSTTDATTTTAASVMLSGGLAVAKKVYALGYYLSGDANITGASGAVTIAASGSNQNVTLTSSGTGETTVLTSGTHSVLKVLSSVSGGSARMRLNRLNTSSATALEFLTTGASDQYYFSVPNNATISGGNTFALIYYNGSADQFYFTLDTAGVIKMAGTTDASSSSTGQLVTSGGVGIAKKLYVGSTTAASSTTTGSAVFGGGLGVAGDIYLGTGTYYSGGGNVTGGGVGDIYVSAAGTNRDVTLRASGTGAVRVGINTSAPGMVSGTQGLYLVQPNSTNNFLQIDAWTAEAGLTFRPVYGTAASPTANIADGVLGLIEGKGYANGAYTAARASILFRSSEAWTSAAQGSYIRFNTTVGGTIVPIEAARLSAGGNLLVGTTADTGLTGAGNLSVAGGMLRMGNATSNFLNFQTAGGAAPAFTTRSAGTKVVLYDQLSGSSVDYGLGVESNFMWASVGQQGSTTGFKWYGGTTESARLLTTGKLSLFPSTPTTDSTFVAGSYELQPYALNNVLFGDNSYFNGTNDVYRATGYASRIQFQSGDIYFRGAPSGTAAGTITWVNGLTVRATGGIELTKTVTATGTTGAQTINKATGAVNFAAAASSLVVTNSLVTTSSVIILTVGTNDSTMHSAKCVAVAGSFTIYPNAAPTAETRVYFHVTN